MKRPASLPLAVVTVALLWACSGNPALPSEQMEAAEVAVGKAAASKLPPEAQPDLDKAQGKLDGAKAALAAHDHREARRLAEQARADAELAIARTDLYRAKKTLEILQKPAPAPPPPPTYGAGGR